MPEPHPPSASPAPLLREGGEMAARIGAHDWAATPLGPPEQWPAALRAHVHLMLVSRQPMYLAWTPDLIALYNDAYRPILGNDKHPQALGARTADIFGQDGYPGLKPVFEAALEQGEGAAFENLLVPLVRHGYMEECYFDVGYTPVYVEQDVAGVFSSVTETTERVLAARRTKTLAALTALLVGAHEAHLVAQALCQVAEQNPYDLPLVALYLPNDRGDLHLACSTGLPDPQSFTRPPPAWTGGPGARVVSIDALTTGPWPEPVRQLTLLPLTSSDTGPPLGLLVLGINARKRLDDAYREFALLLGGQGEAALRAAHLTGELRSRNAELAAKTRAMEGFAQLSLDFALETDPYTLVCRAQEILLSLLPAGYAVYYEPEGELWRLKAQVGSLGSAALQAVVDAGLPLAAPSLHTPWTTLAPLYQDAYAKGADTPSAVVEHINSVSTLPVLVRGQPVGVLGVGLFQAKGWTAADRVVLETAMRNLGLALERAQSVAQLAAERSKLVAANEELEAFAYSVSHDLRAPVRHIAGFNDMLRRSLGPSLDAKSLRYLTVVDDAARRMNILIDAMLELARTARLPLRLGWVNLGTLTARAREESLPELLEREVRWTVAPLPMVLGDHDTLQQVMLNLISNAVKYTRTRDVARVDIWAEERAQDWAVFVRDNGVGFDPRYRDKLFGVFQRLHHDEEFEGTGVGLANVRRVISRHGGTVFAQGAPGEGATFGFTLPKSG